MKKIWQTFRILLAAVFSLSLLVMSPLPQAQAAFAERPVAFVVLDHDGGVDGKDYTQWRSVVKWAYHFPNYQIVDGGEAQQLVSEGLQGVKKVTAATLAPLAEKAQADVLVVARVYELEERMVHSLRFDDDGPYVYVGCSADLYVYKKDGEKFLQKRLRQRGIKDMGNYEKPSETVKWALSKLVNTMEGRPVIGE